MTAAIISWFVFSLIVGFMGSGRKIGFFGGFMLSLLLSPLIGFIIVLVSPTELDMAVKKKLLADDDPRRKPLKPRNYKPKKKVSPEKSKAVRKGVDLKVYQNNFGVRAEDMSHLTPAEARRELGDAKNSSDFNSSGEYYGLIDVISSPRDEKYLDLLAGFSDEDTQSWFKKNIDRKINMSSLIWEETAKILAPMHEEALLKKIEGVDAFEMDNWVRSHKRKGWFFTDKVYNKALKIRMGEN